MWVVVAGGWWWVVWGQTLRQVVAQLELGLLRPCQFEQLINWYSPESPKQAPPSILSIFWGSSSYSTVRISSVIAGILSNFFSDCWLYISVLARSIFFFRPTQNWPGREFNSSLVTSENNNECQILFKYHNYSSSQTVWFTWLFNCQVFQEFLHAMIFCWEKVRKMENKHL